MARKIKIDNAVLKRRARKERQRRKGQRAIRKFILIVCEGEKTEPNYFNAFRKDLPKGVLENYSIEVDGTGRNTLSMVEGAMRIRDTREKEHGRKYDQVWAVFDRDSFPAQQFNEAIQKAENEGLRNAWSNEAFEIWYLLHFHFFQNGMSREDYQPLIERELSARLGADFQYEKNMPEMYTLLKKYGDRELAIAWAESLDQIFAGRTDFSEHNPCTKVYLLVQELLKLKV